MSPTLVCLSAVPHGYRLDFYPVKLFHYRIKTAKCVPVPEIALPELLGSLRRLEKAGSSFGYKFLMSR